MLIGKKIRLQPNKSQIQDFRRFAGANRFSWNESHAFYESAYKNKGKLTTLKGTDYDKLGLPYKRETVEYHEYMVVADGVSVKCIVTKGKVAKMFDSNGGAIQFLHYQPIIQEISSGKIKEVTTWLKKKK